MHRVYPKYRIKPTVIEAVRVGKDAASWDECLNFICIDEEYICQAAMDMIAEDGGIEVPSQGGHVLAEFGYYILRDKDGNYSVCRPEDFDKLCERIEPSSEEMDHIRKVFDNRNKINEKGVPFNV